MVKTPMIDDPFGGRSIPEWVGRTPDSKIPGIVRDRVKARNGGLCYLSGIEIAGKPWQVEHVKPLSMGGEHRETNMRPVLAEPHREKTDEETRLRKKADRIRRKRDGTWDRPQGNSRLQSRGFPPGRNRQ